MYRGSIRSTPIYRLTLIVNLTNLTHKVKIENMTKDQREFINDIKRMRHRPDFVGSMYPTADDPKGEMKQAMQDLAKATGMKFMALPGMLGLVNEQVHPSKN